MATVYHHYNQEQLDLQYDNRRRIDNFEEFANYYHSASERTRAEQPDRLDISYGPSDAEVLDVFLPSGGGSGLPVQVFFHGGYWRAFASRDWDYVCGPVNEAGGISVVVNYALMPGVTMEELLRQCGASLTWTRDNIGDHGGDPSRIHISGHSAGGHIVAMMLSHRDRHGTPIAGAVAISGLYDLEPIRLCYLNETLQLQENDVSPNSPIHNLPSRLEGPLVIAYGALESDEYARQATTYHRLLNQQGLAPELRAVNGVEHMAIARDLGTRDTDMTDIILKQMGLV